MFSKIYQFTGKKAKTNLDDEEAEATSPAKHTNETIPYNLVTQQSIPDKSIADSVEALIGAYLTTTGPFGALLFMSWLGVRVLPSKVIPESQLPKSQFDENGKPIFYMKIPSKAEVILFANLKPPASPLLRYEADCETELEVLLKVKQHFYQEVDFKPLVKNLYICFVRAMMDLKNRLAINSVIEVTYCKLSRTLLMQQIS